MHAVKFWTWRSAVFCLKSVDSKSVNLKPNQQNWALQAHMIHLIGRLQRKRIPGCVCGALHALYVSQSGFYIFQGVKPKKVHAGSFWDTF